MALSLLFRHLKDNAVTCVYFSLHDESNADSDIFWLWRLGSNESLLSQQLETLHAGGIGTCHFYVFGLFFWCIARIGIFTTTSILTQYFFKNSYHGCIDGRNSAIYFLLKVYKPIRFTY